MPLGVKIKSLFSFLFLKETAYLKKSHSVLLKKLVYYQDANLHAKNHGQTPFLQQLLIRLVQPKNEPKRT